MLEKDTLDQLVALRDIGVKEMTFHENKIAFISFFERQQQSMTAEDMDQILSVATDQAKEGILQDFSDEDRRAAETALQKKQHDELMYHSS
jgi:hypothetical protein